MLATISPVSLAQSKQGEVDLAVVVPKEIALLLSAYQPNCSLKVEQAELHAYLKGGSVPDLKLKHQGTIPIKNFKVAYVDSTGSGGSWTISRKTVLPGQIITVSEESPSVRIIPLSDDLRGKLQLNGGMKGTIVFIVVRIEYADGTIYDDERLYEAIKKYFDK